LGDAWRAVVVPVAALFTGEVGRGADILFELWRNREKKTDGVSIEVVDG
jgi:hypothetical protein